jgi:hypothetical protein
MMPVAGECLQARPSAPRRGRNGVGRTCPIAGWRTRVAGQTPAHASQGREDAEAPIGSGGRQFERRCAAPRVLSLPDGVAESLLFVAAMRTAVPVLLARSPTRSVPTKGSNSESVHSSLERCFSSETSPRRRKAPRQGVREASSLDQRVLAPRLLFSHRGAPRIRRCA